MRDSAVEKKPEVRKSGRLSGKWIKHTYALKGRQSDLLSREPADQEDDCHYEDTAGCTDRSTNTRSSLRTLERRGSGYGRENKLT